jgi:hypothetical protein
VIQAGKDLPFRAEALDDGGALAASLHNLDSDRMGEVGICMNGPVDGTHAAMPDRCFNEIRPEAFAYERVVFDAEIKEFLDLLRPVR